MTTLLTRPAIVMRPPQPEDAPALGRICYDAFRTISERHAFPSDFPSAEAAIGFMGYVLSRADVHGVVAENDGRVVGSNFLWEGDDIAGVGPVTVDPSQQNGSIGRQLMEALLRHAQHVGIADVRLVQAAYHARSLSLYTKLGFVSREPLVLMRGNALEVALPRRRVRAAHPNDKAAIDDLCRRVHGHTRAGEVNDALHRSAASVVELDGRITGYTTGIGFFGHSVSETTEDMKALIGAASAFTGPGFLLPIRNPALFRWCLEQGLRVVQPMTLMSIGAYNEPRGAFLPSILY